jgi:hypothetical protein
MHMAFAGQYALFIPHEIWLNVLLVPQPAGGMSPPLLLPLVPPVEQLPLLVQPLAIEFMLQHTSLRPFWPGGQHQPAEQ